MKVAIVGRGRVGTALARALQPRMTVRLLATRTARTSVLDDDVVLLAVRDGALRELVDELSKREHPRAVFVHLAGAFGPEVLAPLRKRSRGVAQAHPMLSFASKRHPPNLVGGSLLLRGDRTAVERMKRVARAVGLRPRLWPNVDAALYHAAGALAANGLVALAYAAAELLERAGADKRATANLLAQLLRSVVDNVEQLGARAALTGPVRRGDAVTVETHLAAIRRARPELEAIYRESGQIQLEMTGASGDVPAEALREVERALRSRPFVPARSQKSAQAARPEKRRKRQKKS